MNTQYILKRCNENKYFHDQDNKGSTIWTNDISVASRWNDAEEADNALRWLNTNIQGDFEKRMLTKRPQES